MGRAGVARGSAGGVSEGCALRRRGRRRRSGDLLPSCRFCLRKLLLVPLYDASQRVGVRTGVGVARGKLHGCEAPSRLSSSSVQAVVLCSAGE